DRLLQEKWQVVAVAEKSVSELRNHLHSLQKQWLSHTQELQKVRSRQLQLQSLQSQQATDADLAQALPAIEQRLSQLQELQQQQPLLYKNLSVPKSLSLAQLQAEQIALNSSLPLQEEKRTLLSEQIIVQEREWALLQQIANLNEARQQLRQGEACPLCGALNHPYLHKELPAPDGAWQRLQQRRIELRSLEKEIESLRLRQQTVAWGINWQQALTAAQQAMQRFAVDLGMAANVTVLLSGLQKRAQQWQINQEELRKLAEREAVLLATVQQAQEQQEQWQQRLLRDEQQLQLLRDDWKELQQQRQNLFAAKDPQQHWQRLEQLCRQREHDQQQAAQRSEELNRLLALLEHEIMGLQERLQSGLELLLTAEREWLLQLQQAGFADEKVWQLALLEESQRLELQRRAQQLDEEGHHLQRRHTELQQQLAEEESRALSTNSTMELQQQRQEWLGQQQQLQQQWGAIEQRLRDQEHNRQERQRRHEAWQQQQQACERWEILHDLIGSADGKKFRNFAQGLTFERVVRQANRQLLRINDRYQLQRDPQQPLELNVLDLYQAGEVRSSKNLSGGESFLVSLALALGLAQLSGQRIRVDSLFLDEGFGTLDEDALQIALQSLATLQQEGKQIGIISHVPALREQIPLQIRIQPQGGGRSSISGPGCTRINRNS
ncbi:SbcC/MukB-like Walker B domain-containing protein, partial [Candidatus Magnetaquicoccus inordinatus]|uniref:SbcC/MukB-like Walker B domain-containing protein n=1 Tax=Candidatus Magnetaquicoccus inordinatus TaxID=2496818 RepID=UPI001D0E6384